MSRAAIKYQSYFISYRSRGRSTFGRLIFFSFLLPPSLSFYLTRSLISFCFIVIFACLISYNLHMVLRVNVARNRNKVSIIPPHLTERDQSAPLRDAERRVVPRCVPPREYEECQQPGDTLPQFSHCSSSACTYEINLRVRGWERRKGGRKKEGESAGAGWSLWPRDRLVIAIAFRGRVGR